MSHTTSRQLRLGLFVQPLGHHVSGWRLTETLGSPTDIEWLTWIAKRPKRVSLICSLSVMRWQLASTACHQRWRALNR